MRNMPKIKRSGLLLPCLLGSVFVIMLGTVCGQSVTPVAAGVQTAGSVTDYVSIQVDKGSMLQVLNAFALQTGRNVVVGSEVISEGVNIHLNHVRWDEALEVILKPYGFGYRKVGDTIVVSKLDQLAVLSAIEPLETKVFNLKYLDASDVQDVIKGQLSTRSGATCRVAAARGQKGWQFASASGKGSSSSGSAMGKLQRTGGPDGTDQVKSKTLIVTDVPDSLARVTEVLAEVDKIPRQVQIEARFLEVNHGLLRDIGLDWNYHNGTVNVGQKFSSIVPGVFDSSLHPNLAVDPLNALGFASFDDSTLSVYIRMLQEDKDTKLLSAPRILTLNNQEATIIVGQKYPIIKSDVSSGTGSGTTSTSLDYYENIGIQLNVVPQICVDGFINMIVHPSVSSIIGFASGKTSGIVTNNSLTEYPIINTREAETQIMLKNNETIVIGGLLEDRKAYGESKVPFLGDIPLTAHPFAETS